MENAGRTIGAVRTPSRIGRAGHYVTLVPIRQASRHRDGTDLFSPDDAPATRADRPAMWADMLRIRAEPSQAESACQTIGSAMA